MDNIDLLNSLVAWLRWHATSKKEIEAAPPECRPLLVAMSKASGYADVAMLATEIQKIPALRAENQQLMDANKLLWCMVAEFCNGKSADIICSRETVLHTCCFAECPLTHSRTPK